MELNLNTIRSLDANKTYYIANSTGQIKEAGAWQKFKCFFGVGDGRASRPGGDGRTLAASRLGTSFLRQPVRKLAFCRPEVLLSSGRFPRHGGFGASPPRGGDPATRRQFVPERE